MSTPIIQIKNIGKKYNIAHQRGKYITLRDVLMNILKSPFKFFLKKTRAMIGMETKEEFWALRDISFDVQKGEVIGIIGHNGAGKSTLLKILSQITPPTEGEIILNGRVGSLLEVGTGFHPELTGRENIFLNGAILGMPRKEIAEKFDKIVEFAGIEKFLDTPVKFYSSGMYVRLAFSVAAHLEPDILIVDEVLAVGDAEFQKKCLGKMDEITKKEGRTVIFVSHNMEAIKNLCPKCILIESGRIKKFGPTLEVIDFYLTSAKEAVRNEWIKTDNKTNNEYFSPARIYIADQDGKKIEGKTPNNTPKNIMIESEIETLDPSLTIGYAVYNMNGDMLYWTYQTDVSQEKWPEIKKGKNIFKGEIPARLLNEGVYRIELIGGLNNAKWLFEPGKDNPGVYMEIFGGLSDSPYFTSRRPTIISPIIKWEIL